MQTSGYALEQLPDRAGSGATKVWGAGGAVVVGGAVVGGGGGGEVVVEAGGGGAVVAGAIFSVVVVSFCVVEARGMESSTAAGRIATCSGSAVAHPAVARNRAATAIARFVFTKPDRLGSGGTEPTSEVNGVLGQRLPGQSVGG